MNPTSPPANLQSVITAVQKSVSESMAVGVVDITSGLLLGVHAADGPAQDVLELAAYGAGDLFASSNVASVERLLDKPRGEGPFFQEMMVLSGDLLHVFLRFQRRPELVLVVIAPLASNLGLILSQTRASLTVFEAAA